MRSLAHRWSFIAFLLLAQCSDSAEDPKLVALRDAGAACKAALAEADYAGAAAGAQATLDQSSIAAADPALADQLRFCGALARTFDKLNESSTFIKKFAEAMTDLFQARQAPGAYGAQANTLESTILDNVLTAVLVPLITDLEGITADLATVASHGDFHWRAERLPVQIAGNELFDAAGAYDAGELEILRGLVGSVLGALYSLEGLDYRVNIAAVVEYAKLADSPLKHYEEHPVAAIFNAAAVLLGTAPSFLALKEKDGADWANKAGVAATDAVKALLDAAEAIKASQDDQATHVIEYKRDTGQDYFVVHLQFKKALSKALRVDLEKFNDTSIPLRDDALASINHVYESLRAGGGVRASVQDDLFPILALIGVVALKSGALDAVVDEGLDQIDPALAEKLRATLDYGEISQEHFLSLLITAVPVRMEVDLGRVYAQPSDLRTVLPAWFQPDPKAGGGFAMDAFTTATLVVEYECAANPLLTGTKRSFFCDAPTDQPHFADLVTSPPWKNQTSDNFGPSWEGAIAKDGVASRGPYVGFKDPTFGGALYIDYATSNVPAPGADKVAPATQSALNALLATMTEAALTVYQ